MGYENLELFTCKCGKRKILRNINMWEVAPVKCPECDTLIDKQIPYEKKKNADDKLITGILLWNR